MSDPSVSERRIRPIQDAVGSGNWKQALKECEKWQKKGEKSDKFLALRAFVLVRQPDHSQRGRGQAETLRLCHRNPAVINVEAIHFLQDALKDLSIQNEEAPNLWNRAAVARPTDQELLMTWLNNSIAESNWLSAQKAAMALRKAFPEDHQYEFWNILMCFLVHNDNSLPEKDRNLFGSLAYRLISKAAESIPSEPRQLLSSGKAISMPEELYLLVHIYLGTGHASEAVDLLRGSLSEVSRIGQQDPQLVNGLLLDALEASERWPEAYEVCKKLVEKPDYRDNDRVWGLLHKASSDPQLKDDYRTLVNDCTMKRQLRDRPAHLIRLKDLRAKAEENVPYANILIACTQYYQLYEDKSFCFEDLKDSLESFDEFHRKDFSTFLEEEISQKASIYNRLFKLKYDRLIAPANEDESAILDRATRALKLYNSSRAESTPCPEASLIAALDILLAATLHSPPITSYIIRAILLLSVSHTHHEDYYPYSILLVHCYINLGLLSLAIETFVELSIKNLQWENVGHLLLTRISSLHPFQHGKGESLLNPSGALDAGLSMLDRSTDALNKGIGEGLKNGSYSNIIDSVKLRQDFERSVNRQIYALEDSKISRLMGEVDAVDGAVMIRAQEPVDKRDFSFLPKYIKADGRVYDALRTGPLPGAAWVDAMAMVQCLMTYLKDDSPNAPGKDRLNEFVVLAGPPQRIKTALTVSEWRLYEAGMLVQAMVQGMIKGDEVRVTVQKMTHNVEALVEQNGKRGSEEGEEGVEGCVRGISQEEGLKVPGWEYLHASFLQFELGYLINALAGWHARQANGKGKKATPSAGLAGLKPEDIQHLKKALGDLQNSIKESAKQVKKGLNEGGVLGTLVDVALARNEQGESHKDGEKNVEGEGWKAWSEGMGKLCTDEAEIETVVGRWMESWEDACEGVGGVKMKLGG